MEKFIPYDKLSKKEKRKRNAAKRSMWQIKPTSRIKDSAKVYNRKRLGYVDSNQDVYILYM